MAANDGVRTLLVNLSSSGLLPSLLNLTSTTTPPIGTASTTPSSASGQQHPDPGGSKVGANAYDRGPWVIPSSYFNDSEVWYHLWNNYSLWRWNTTSNSTDDSDLDGDDDAIPHTLWEIVIITVIVTLLVILTAGGNLLVMMAFKIEKQLQTVSNYFLLSLAVADFTIGIVSMPLYTVMLLMARWPFGQYVCDIWLTLDYTMSNASVANLLVISFDRYLSVTRPLTYRAKRTPKRAAIMIGTAWTISVFLWTPWIWSWPHIEGRRTVPENDCYIQFLYSNEYITIITACLAFYVPVSIMFGLYWKIYRETEKRQKGLAKLQAQRHKHAHRKPANSSDDEVLSLQKRSDSSPDLEDIEVFVESLPQHANKKWYQKCCSCCKIDRDVDYMDDSSSSEPPGTPVETPTGSTRQHNRNEHHSLHLHQNGRQNSRNSGSSQLMIPLIQVDSTKTTPTSPSTDITGTFSRHSNLSSVSTNTIDNGNQSGMKDRESKIKSKERDSMYTILIKLPEDSSNDEKPTIRMVSDTEEDEETDEHVDKIEVDLPGYPNQCRHVETRLSLPPRVGIGAIPASTTGRRYTQGADPIRVAMQARIAAKLVTKAKMQRNKRKHLEKKQEKKAAKTLSAILLAFIVTWTPYNLFTVINPFCVGCINPTLYAIGEYTQILIFQNGC